MSNSQYDYDIFRVSWSKHQLALKSIRKSVFIDEQGVPESLEWDEFDETAIHLLAMWDKTIAVGTARVLKSGQIGRMAVLPQYRGCGIGKALLDEAISIGRQQGSSPLFLNAQTSVQALYASAGFKPVGEVFHEADIPHIRMELPTLGTSDLFHGDCDSGVLE